MHGGIGRVAAPEGVVGLIAALPGDLRRKFVRPLPM